MGKTVSRKMTRSVAVFFFFSMRLENKPSHETISTLAYRAPLPGMQVAKSWLEETFESLWDPTWIISALEKWEI